MRQTTTATAADAPGLSHPAGEHDLPDPERGPLRRCVVTRVSAPKETMLRFVLGPGRQLVPDLEGRLPGRGMWLSARADVLERALARGAFAKSARGPVHAPPDLRLRIEEGLKRRLRDLLGFARRGGHAICGREKVREWLRAGRVGLLVEASDGSPAERERLVGGRDLPWVAPLPAASLGGIFGRDHAVHVAIAPGRMAETIAVEAARLAGLQCTGGGQDSRPPPQGAAERTGPAPGRAANQAAPPGVADNKGAPAGAADDKGAPPGAMA